MCVAFATVSTASAQTGYVEGRVMDGTKPLAYANASPTLDVPPLECDGAFLAGQRGDRWEDASPIDLGIIKVPIRPIGMPIRP